MAIVLNPIFAANCTPRWPSPPRPSTATTSPGRAPLLRSALNVVMPAHISGAASTEDRSSGTRGEGRRRGDHVLGVAAVRGHASHQRFGFAGKCVAAPAGIAIPAIAALPADADALARAPPGNSAADRIDAADHLMPGDARVLNVREQPLLGDAVAMADAAGLHL